MQSKLLKELLSEHDLETVFSMLEIEPYDALMKLYEIGEIDLERLEDYYNEYEDD